MEDLSQQQFTLDDWQVSAPEGVLSRSGEEIRIEPKVMEVLVYFASRQGEVITRDELERDVWHGALVGYDAVTSTIIKLRKALKDNAKNPRYIATIPKRGYQLITTVRPAGEQPVQGPQDKIRHSDTANTKQFFTKPLLAVTLLTAVLFTFWLWFSQADNELSNTPSILVLPFENKSDNNQHDSFVDGITEDVITDLSRLSRLSVMASSATFKYKGKQVTPQEIKTELNVDYILQGNIRRLGGRLRFNIQLIDTNTGFNAWAERFDRKPEEIFALQDEITGYIIDALSIQQSPGEIQRLAQRATNNLQAYEHFLEGQRLSKVYSKQANTQANDAYRKAIKIDPTYGRAYGALAFVLAVDYRRGWTDNPVETLDRALGMAEQAVKLDSSIPQTHWALGYVYFMRKEHAKAEKAVVESIRIAPNYADGYGLLALINNNLGNAQQALDYVEKGMQLNPYYTWDYLYNKGRALYTLGHYHEAINSLEQAQLRNENAIPIKIYLAASYVRLDRLDDAEWIIDQLLVINPATTLDHTDKTIPIVVPELKKALLDDLRKAGLPEGD
ncbi:MAG: winged helix-turn-helix domain-containing protein [Thioalkalispiraceae bacterium]|jgi:TolB-like protein/DNA-binding winged helix-turn-helix (wHTH) protein